MTDLRGWAPAEQHLAPDAIVAFVDGELSATANARATSHLARCPLCAGETVAQRQARAAVRAAESPAAPPGLLAILRAIPEDVDLPTPPDQLAVNEDGQLVVVLRPVARQGGNATMFGAGRALGSAAQIGSTRPLGSGDAVLGSSGTARRARHGASIVVSGLVLGALALVNTTASVVPDRQGGPPEVGPAVAGPTEAVDGAVMHADPAPLLVGVASPASSVAPTLPESLQRVAPDGASRPTRVR